MDQKPYRTGTPAHRPGSIQGAPRPVPRTPSAATPTQTTSAPKVPSSSPSVQKRVKPSKKKLLLIGIPTLLIIALIGWWLYNRSTSTLIDGSSYQAVFLSNGQVYFGKLHEKNDAYSTLTDVYYFESNNSTSSASATATTNSSTPPKLIKLGQEIHAPQDQMAIKNSQILFFENISSTGQVAKAIESYQQKQQ